MYEPQRSGNHQQVTGESTAVLKGITDNSDRFDRQQRKTGARTEINLSFFVCLSPQDHLLEQWPFAANLTFNCVLYLLMGINPLCLSVSLQVVCVFG